MTFQLPWVSVRKADGSLNPEAVQADFDELVRLAVGTGGRQLELRSGSGLVQWPGGSPFTDVSTVGHGLTRVPTSVTATATLGVGTAPCVIHVVAVDASNIQFRGYAADGSSPAAATQKPLYWVALG